MLTIDLPEELEQRLRDLAQKTALPFEAVLREVFKIGLEEFEETAQAEANLRKLDGVRRQA